MHDNCHSAYLHRTAHQVKDCPILQLCELHSLGLVSPLWFDSIPKRTHIPIHIILSTLHVQEMIFDCQSTVCRILDLIQIKVLRMLRDCNPMPHLKVWYRHYSQCLLVHSWRNFITKSTIYFQHIPRQTKLLQLLTSWSERTNNTHNFQLLITA